MGVTVILAQTSFDNGGIHAGPGNPLTVADLINPDGTLREALPGRTDPSFIGATCKCEVADIDADGFLTGIVGAMVSTTKDVCIIASSDTSSTLSLTHCFAIISGWPRMYFGSCREYHDGIGRWS